MIDKLLEFALYISHGVVNLEMKFHRRLAKAHSNVQVGAASRLDKLLIIRKDRYGRKDVYIPRNRYKPFVELILGTFHKFERKLHRIGNLRYKP
jgi:hypothetical protein